MQLFPIGRTYDFMGRRKPFILVSVLLIVLSFVAILWKPGLKVGTDFAGGTEVEIGFLQSTTSHEIEKAVVATGFSRPDVIKVDDPKNLNRYLVRIHEVSTIGERKQGEIAKALCVGDQAAAECPPQRRATEIKVSPGGDKVSIRYAEPPDLAWVKERVTSVPGIALRSGDNNPFLQNPRDHKVEIQLKSKGDQLLDGLRDKLGAEKVPPAALRVEWIGPKAGAQLRDAALKSIGIALVFIMAYIALRFDLRFSAGAVLALLHDAIGSVGILTLVQREVNLTTVAAVLTIVGYSVNDTVVVYDRVRDNLARMRGSSFVTIINVSLSEMLSRTVLTNLTVVISLAAFFVWGTGTLQDFAFTLIVGVVLGTYSSIYIALPFTEWLDRRFFSTMMGAPKAKNPVRKKVDAVV